ncbi:hypothetical protein [Clostridium sp. AF22-10]|uniref:hypothetical protein n=1 Tax=Clostridium sp. AF22-10 TaxID=2293004 RepID=UPI0011C23A7B
MGITGRFEGYVSNPLYLFNNGSYGGGQSGISIMSNHTAYGSVSFGSSIQGSKLYKGDIIIRFNNIQNLSGWNYLKIYGNVEMWARIGGGVSTKIMKYIYHHIKPKHTGAILRLYQEMVFVFVIYLLFLEIIGFIYLLVMFLEVV